jgi:hypothetical protein
MAQKSFADVFDLLISNPKRMLAFLLLLAGLLSIVLVSVYLFTRIFGLRPAQLEMTREGTLLYFQNYGASNFITIVHPRGWQNSHVEVRKGDRITFNASGSITISMQALLDKVEQYTAIERKILETKKYPPEAFLTNEQKELLASEFPWMGPNGDESGETERITYSGRSQNKIFSDQPFGVLIGAIKPEHDEGLPNEKNGSFIFVIGAKKELEVSDTEGELWFNVNDALIPDFRQFPDFFYSDNLGYFMVKVRIE